MQNVKKSKFPILKILVVQAVVVGVLAAVTVVFVVLSRRKAADAAKEAGSGKEETGENEQ